MTIGTVCQILDTVSFILITPEFMRDETLARIRSVSGRFASWWWSFDQRKWYKRPLALMVVAASVLGWGLVFFGVYYLPYITPLTIVPLLIVFLTVLLTLCAKVVETAAVRRRMFFLGAATFFVSRGLSIWFGSAG